MQFNLAGAAHHGAHHGAPPPLPAFMQFNLAGAVQPAGPALPPFHTRLFFPRYRVPPGAPIPPPVPPPNSYHFAMLLDAGRVPNVDDAILAQPIAAVNPPLRFSVAMVARQREAVGFDGFKSSAATLLLGGVHSPDGMDGVIGALYLASPIAAQHIEAAVMSALGHFCRCTVRVDYQILTGPDVGPEKAHDFVNVNGHDYRVPFIVKGNKHVVSTPAMLRAATVTIVNNVRTFIDEMRVNGSSDRVLLGVVGAHVWATPTNVRAAGGGIVSGPGAGASPGLADWGPADGKCFARALMTGLDRFVFARSAVSVCSILESARHAVTTDLAKPSASRPEVAARLAVLQAALAKPALYVGGISSTTSASFLSASKLSRRSPAISAALAAALSGAHTDVQLQDPLFSAPFEVTEDSIEFVRSKLAPHIKLQVWGPTTTGEGAALDFAAKEVTWEFVHQGGIVLNILCSDTHAAYMRSPAVVNASITRTNRRLMCPLCGYGIPHSATGAPIGTATRLFEHIVLGCEIESGGAVTGATVQVAGLSRVRRTLSKTDAASRFHPSLECFLLDVPDSASVGLTAVAATGIGAWTPYDVLSSDAMSAWTSVRTSHMAVGSTSERDYVLADVLRALVTSYPESPQEHAFDNAQSAVDMLFTPGVLRVLLDQSMCVWPREHASGVKTLPGGKCFICHRPLSAPSLWSDAVCEDAGSESDSAFAECEPDDSTVVSCPVTGTAFLAHAECSPVLRRTRQHMREVVVYTSSAALLGSVVALVCRPIFVETMCGGALPHLLKSRDGLRGVCVRVRSTLANNMPACSVRFRCVPVEGQISAQSVLQWAHREFTEYGLWPLHFESDIAYSRAVLLDSQTPEKPLISVLTSRTAIAQYNRMTKSGRLLTGCAAWHAPLPPGDRRVVRLGFDFTAMYPAVTKEWPLPSEEHTDMLIDSFATRLAEGVEFLRAYPVHDEKALVARVELSGKFPASLHSRLRQFPPFYTRMPVPASEYSEFQRERLGIPLASPPQTRSVCHLLPLDRVIVFVREAQLLLRLGFECSFIGDVRGCKGSYWARDFMVRAETRRRAAQRAGDAAASTAAKRLVNCVIGAMNMNVGAFTSLHGIRSDEIDPATLEATGGGSKARDEDGSHRKKREYKRRLADDPRFTGRTYTCGAGTYIEFSAKSSVHSQSTAFSLAVQAYARCRHAELWYGDSQGRAGIIDVFPTAKVLYGNTDSLYIEIAVSDADIAAGITDARVKLLQSPCAAWFDLSTLAEDSELWSFLPGVDREVVASRAGEWGLVKEISEWQGYDAFVVNGPNRCGMRTLGASGNTAGADVLKSVRSEYATSATLEEYAADWLSNGAETSAVSRWGNRACVVSADGSHTPFGYLE